MWHCVCQYRPRFLVYYWTTRNEEEKKIAKPKGTKKRRKRTSNIEDLLVNCKSRAIYLSESYVLTFIFIFVFGFWYFCPVSTFYFARLKIEQFSRWLHEPKSKTTYLHIMRQNVTNLKYSILDFFNFRFVFYTILLCDTKKKRSWMTKKIMIKRNEQSSQVKTFQIAAFYKNKIYI